MSLAVFFPSSCVFHERESLRLRQLIACQTPRYTRESVCRDSETPIAIERAVRPVLHCEEKRPASLKWNECTLNLVVFLDFVTSVVRSTLSSSVHLFLWFHRTQFYSSSQLLQPKHSSIRNFSSHWNSRLCGHHNWTLKTQLEYNQYP